ncbi:MAG: hypothetical protein Q7T33_02790 [Dehalococcoidia bacterium]|nr:hypothetical protein [Dehalococcoidia bacterium]
MSIVQIIGAGNMPARLAALFWVGLERGASIIVAADPPSSGKTTTLSALLAFTPPDTLVYFTRGQGETFSLPVLSTSFPTYLLINEMSDHIPVYTWDDHARRAFQLLSEGYSLASTMHADSVQGVLSQLEGDLQIPRSQIANLTFIVPMYIGRGEGTVRRVTEVAFLQPDGATGVAMGTIAAWDRDADAFDIFPEPAQRDVFARWAKLTPGQLAAELDRREGFLETLRQTNVESVREVSLAIEGFYDQVIKATQP